ncbi:hypothetical protein BGZ98_001707 [Dissophora globulifera]|nr:hypothetical protein BGZ98_001707 [Dissophora globulifera]
MACANEECPETNRGTTFQCSKCKNIRYCSKSCQIACHSWHKKSCIDPKKTAFNLMKTVYADDFKVMNDELKASYGFEKCKTQHDRTYLLGLYQGLIKYHCDINELDRAFNENKVPEFIVSTFFYEGGGPQYCGEYFKWFIQNLDICRH